MKTLNLILASTFGVWGFSILLIGIGIFFCSLAYLFGMVPVEINGDPIGVKFGFSIVLAFIFLFLALVSQAFFFVSNKIKSFQTDFMSFLVTKTFRAVFVGIFLGVALLISGYSLFLILNIPFWNLVILIIILGIVVSRGI